MAGMESYFARPGDLIKRDPAGDQAFLSEREEVVKLVDVEHAIDALRDELRDEHAEGRGLLRVVGAYPGESLIAAVVRLVEEVEHYRKMRLESPALSDTSIAVLDQVPRSLSPTNGWSSVGETTIPATEETIVAITHSGVDGLMFVTADAWECYENAWGRS